MKKLLQLIALLTSFLLHSQTKKAAIKFHDKVFYDVFVYTNSDTINITKFKPWVEIKDLQISSNNNYVFFRYKPKGKAYKLVCYELNTLNKIAEITPGYGGTFKWNKQNQILHTWGCGTNCANLRVYNTQLEDVFYSFSTGGFKFSPDKTKVAQLNLTQNQVWVVNLSPNGFSRGFTKKIHHDINWNTFGFQTNDLLVLSNNPKSNINLSNLKWVTLSPEQINSFYLEK